jgi:hypothetical protein
MMINPIFAGSTPPLVALDFLAGSLDNRVAVSRALNTATRINKSGYIEVVNANLPRFDYDPGTLSPRGLLIEESRTNLASYSEDFRNSADAGATRPNTYLNMTLVQNATTSPYGVANASDKLVETSATGSHGCFRIGIIASAGTYAYTVRVKPGERTKVQLQFGSTGNTVRFTLQGAGSVDYTLSATGFIRASADGWYYCTLVASPGLATSVSILMLDDAGNTSYAGDPTKGLFVDCLQVEAGGFPTSYIPNLSTGTTARNADVATVTGSNFSGWWQAGRGSAVVKARPSTVSGTRPWVQFDDTTANNIIAFRGNTTNPELYVRAGGSDQAQIDAGTIAANTSYRLAGAWATNDCAASLNSGTSVRDGVATIPVVTQARLGSDGTNYLNGHLEAIEYYEERVPNSSLQVVSSVAGYRSIIGPVFRDTIIS